MQCFPTSQNSIHTSTARSLTDFLCRQPTITALFLDDLYETPQSMCPLPHLTSLGASPSFVSSFLSSPAKAPVLKCIHLFTSLPLAKYLVGPCRLDTNQLHHSLAAIGTCPTVYHLSLTMSGCNVGEWMRSFGTVAQHRTRSTLVLPHITCLTVYDGGSVYLLLPQWVHVLFPNLETLALLDMNNPPPPCEDLTKSHFIRRMTEACPMLSNVSFSIDASPEPIRQWLQEIVDHYE